MLEILDASICIVIAGETVFSCKLYICVMALVALLSLICFIVRRYTSVDSISHSYHQVLQQNHILFTVYNLIPDMVFVKDLNGAYIGCNTAFGKFVGRSREEILGSNDRALFNLSLDAAEKFIADDRKTLESGRTNVIEEEITYPDGSKRIVETIKLPLRQQGRLTGLIGISRDITARKKAKQEAIDANRAKSFFLAQMSHELRTPLNAILGMSRIASRNLPEHMENRSKVFDAIEEIRIASSHLLKIINQILDISAIEFGKFKLSLMPHTLASLYAEVNAIAVPLCREQNIVYEHNAADWHEEALLYDQTRLSQVIINLVGNAVKFTQEGGCVTFSCRLREESPTHAVLDFSVTDTGVGMTEKQLQHLFRPFEHGSYAGNAKQTNTGLGLSISQGFIRAMGSEISVDSTLGSGSVFSFSLRLEKHVYVEQEEAEEPCESLPDLHGHRILIVDDVEINRIVVREVLEEVGATTEEASDGAMALKMYQDAGAEHYSLILMDVQMPVMDGYESARSIRELEGRQEQHVPIVAMTAHAYAEDIKAALESGMNGHLAKPIELAELSRLLTILLKRK
ncbi:MAG: response regulator [Desulfovibrio sp.]|nr:response regulator [Desulfovibrio sp.]